MSRQYNRTYELSITGTSGQVRIIRELRIAFDVTKSLISFPNLALVSIYNPNEDTKSLLKTKFTKISLSVGYGDVLKRIFTGEIRNVFQKRAQEDLIVEIYAGDGQKDWQNAIYNKTLSENVSVKSAVQDIATTFVDSAIGLLEGLPSIVDKLRGQTLSGSSKDIMDMYAEEYDYQWSILDGEVITTPNDKDIAPGDAVVITPLTGMLGAPTLTEIGVDVNTLLNPLLNPDVPFRIESATADFQFGNVFFRNVPRTEAEGFYRIQEVKHKGDNYGQDWMSSCKGILLSA